MGALAILALLSTAVEVAAKIAALIQDLRAKATEAGATPEQVMEAEANGHVAAQKLTAKADAILSRIGE